MKNEKEIKKLEKAVQDINKRIDKLKEDKLELNNWYKNGNLLFYVTQIHDRQTYGYGFDHGEWDKIEDTMAGGWTFELDKDNVPATNEEVEAALIAEAKKRYKKRIKINYIDTGASSNVYRLDGFMFNSKENALFGTGKCENFSDVIFDKGQWAEIIEEPKVVINGYEMRQSTRKVTFGCAKFDKYWLERLLEACEKMKKNYSTNRHPTIITLDSGVEITVKQLQEIVDNLK